MQNFKLALNLKPVFGPAVAVAVVAVVVAVGGDVVVGAVVGVCFDLFDVAQVIFFIPFNSFPSPVKLEETLMIFASHLCFDFFEKNFGCVLVRRMPVQTEETIFLRAITFTVSWTCV